MVTVDGRVLALLGELQEAMDLAELREALLRVLREAFAADRAAYVAGPSGPGPVRRLALVRPDDAPAGHRVAFTLPSPRGQVLGIELRRAAAPFSPQDRAVLERARPFLIQLYRNAMELTALREVAEGRPAGLDGTGLTPREAEIVRLVALGRSNAAIAADLSLSVRTVHKHLENAFRKLGVGSRSEAAARVWSALGA